MITSSRSPLHVNAATSGKVITPSDSDVVDFNGIYVGVTGDLVVDLFDGTKVTLKNIAAGIIHPMRVTKVYAATTATELVGLKW